MKRGGRAWVPGSGFFIVGRLGLGDKSATFLHFTNYSLLTSGVPGCRSWISALKAIYEQSKIGLHLWAWLRIINLHSRGD